MNNIDKKDVDQLLESDKRQPMDYWQLSRLLEYVTKIVNEIPNNILRQVEPEVSDAVLELENAAKKVIGYTKQLDIVIEEEEKKLDEQLESHYQNVSKKIYAVNEKFKNLPKIDENVRVPYNVEKLVQVSQMIEGMSPESFERLAKLCEIFAYTSK